ncbi:Pal1 cell morphology protein [Metarhizium album ARSEF 1941]|uniref:Pal1 cell morphology protein n=1 Tax=Metarhizium album (strain ARSEF 1941) TaxID=1081103 RepID=A0A0B2X1C7_METAS|nr:Pal1 cell morphology protein [Metarhizium album ARSEF 1941]KHN98880.1 Pal1 cell morphology protein [Metarhizium album ARSEF 1941]
MSSPGPFQQGQLPSPGLSSNNPFRNRAASPAGLDAPFALTTTTSPFADPAPMQRPVSRNPFLDQSQQPLKPPAAVSDKLEHKSLSAEDIFGSLTLDDTMPNDRLPPALTAQRRPSDQVPPLRTGESQQPSDKNRLAKPEEDASRSRKPGPGLHPGTSRSPLKKPVRRPRRNSDSSVMDFNAQPITAEEMKIIEEHRMRDRQRREKTARETESRDKESRESREPRNKERAGKGRSKSGRPSRRMDIIDQLDATSIYGTGLFHHDGPFDALNPHRNRHTSRRAPMQAFPKDSLNNSLGGAGPLNRNPDHATFLGHGTDEAFRDYAGGVKNKNGYNYPGSSSAEPLIFDPVARGSLVHGDESYGLGTSTFLEGTPAARSAIVRRQAEQQQEIADGGLQRKKSLAQRIRHINNKPRDLPSGRLTNPDGVSTKRSPDSIRFASSVGSEPNPFFAEFAKGEESISVGPRGGAKSPASPPASALERRATTDAMTQGEDSPPAKSTGLLGRMKSLKGGRRPKNTDTSSQPAGSGMAM